AITSGGRAADWKTGSFGPYGCPENLSVRFFPNSAGSPLKKLRPQSVTSRIQPGSDVIVCAEMDEQWGYVGAKS
ncbi:IS1 family transposase, partial [Escherichia coli]|uniref:IS1 family transposase n=1 Tax=Escherichia coli TaxID=562 RepID=UPI00203B4C39